MKFIDMKRTLLFIIVFGLLNIFSSALYAATPKIISAKSLKSGEKITLNMDKTPLFKVLLSGLDTNRVMLKSKGKTISLKDWLGKATQKGAKLPRKKQILLAQRAESFPGITSGVLKEVKQLRDFNSFSPETSGISGTVYICGLIVYSCWDVP